MKIAIDILTKELEHYKRSLDKSTNHFDNGQIDHELHQMHVNNITPKIMQLKTAIKILNNVDIK